MGPRGALRGLLWAPRGALLLGLLPCVKTTGPRTAGGRPEEAPEAAEPEEDGAPAGAPRIFAPGGRRRHRQTSEWRADQEKKRRRDALAARLASGFRLLGAGETAEEAAADQEAREVAAGATRRRRGEWREL